MIKVRVEKVKGCSFRGYIETSELTAEQLSWLGVKEDGNDFNYPLSIDVEGDFSVSGSSDDIQIIEISCFAINGLDDLELNDDNADMDDLVEQIRDNADEAYLDHCIAMNDFVDMD